MTKAEAGVEQEVLGVSAGIERTARVPREAAEVLAARYSEDIGRLVSCLRREPGPWPGEPLPVRSGGKNLKP